MMDFLIFFVILNVLVSLIMTLRRPEEFRQACNYNIFIYLTVSIFLALPFFLYAFIMTFIKKE